MISAIINVSQTAPWPLFILDNAGSQHKVQLEPGQMLWYESAKLPHGRPQTFTGEHYDNIFVHFKPVSRHWWRRGAIAWDRGDTPPWRVKLGKFYIVIHIRIYHYFSQKLMAKVKRAS